MDDILNMVGDDDPPTPPTDEYLDVLNMVGDDDPPTPSTDEDIDVLNMFLMY